MNILVCHAHSKIAESLALPAAILSCLAGRATASIGPFLPNLVHQLFTSL